MTSLEYLQKLLQKNAYHYTFREDIEGHIQFFILLTHRLLSMLIFMIGFISWTVHKRRINSGCH